jgi:DNA-binding transcriptional ArsR family regulator
MAKRRTSNRVRQAYLRRLAVVFADPLRLRIVTELYMRSMSATQFFEQFGGGSASRVNRHFKKLAEHGWLRLVDRETGGPRRGGTEHFYRATELAIFDLETWSELPQSIRASFSLTAFKQLAEQIEHAIAGATFDARPDRHLTWTPTLLDRAGWEHLVDSIDSLFESLFEEQADAKLRIAKSAEEPMLATVALVAFESPRDSAAGDPVEGMGVRLPSAEPARGSDLAMSFPVRVSKVFSDALCLRIVAELNMRTMSPSEFHGEFGGASLRSIAGRFKTLTNFGWLKKVDEKSGGERRGATEHFYRATGPAIFDTRTWTDVPTSVKATYSWRTFEHLCEQVRSAMGAGTFDANPERHLSWSHLLLDQLGWEQVVAAVDSLFESLFEMTSAAERRINESGEEPIQATVALAVFESPKGGGPKAP